MLSEVALSSTNNMVGLRALELAALGQCLAILNFKFLNLKTVKGFKDCLPIL